MVLQVDTTQVQLMWGSLTLVQWN